MDTFCGVVQAHLVRYPLMEIQDLYKLAYQAALGAEHAAASQAAIHTLLMKEVVKLSEGPEEPLVDPISPDGRILRVHLRTYIKKGGDLLKLSRAFWETAMAFKGSLDLLNLFWLEIKQQAEEGEVPFQAADLEQYYADRQAGGFQPVHHSAAFRDNYRPAYRIVFGDFWKECA